MYSKQIRDREVVFLGESMDVAGNRRFDYFDPMSGQQFKTNRPFFW